MQAQRRSSWRSLVPPESATEKYGPVGGRRSNITAVVAGLGVICIVMFSSTDRHGGKWQGELLGIVLLVIAGLIYGPHRIVQNVRWFWHEFGWK